MLIDTNVWSELSRRSPDPKIVGWVKANFDACILSAIVQAEMQYGIAKADDGRRRNELRAFHDDLVSKIGDRLLPFDMPAAVAWGTLRATLHRAGKLIGERDMLIAAQALSLGVPLVTRNVGDMERTGAMIINPWRA